MSYKKLYCELVIPILNRGTGPEVWGNCNAPKAITLSALIYCLRCMVGHDIPLNQVCIVGRTALYGV